MVREKFQIFLAELRKTKDTYRWCCPTFHGHGAKIPKDIHWPTSRNPDIRRQLFSCSAPNPPSSRSALRSAAEPAVTPLLQIDHRDRDTAGGEVEKWASPVYTAEASGLCQRSAPSLIGLTQQQEINEDRQEPHLMAMCSRREIEKVFFKRVALHMRRNFRYEKKLIKCAC